MARVKGSAWGGLGLPTGGGGPGISSPDYSAGVEEASRPTWDKYEAALKNVPSYVRPAMEKKMREKFNNEFADWQSKVDQGAGRKAAGFDPVTGRPLSPEFQSFIDPATGQLKDDYQLETQLMDPTGVSGFGQYEKFATGTGPSEYATLATDKLDLESMLQRDAATKEAASATAQARGQLAMRGGLTGGARERLAQGGAQGGIGARQDIRKAQLLGGADIDIQDALSRQSALRDFTGMGLDIEQFNVGQKTGAQKFNIEKALSEVDKGRQFAMDRYGKEAEMWGAEKKAKAQEKQAAASGK